MDDFPQHRATTLATHGIVASPHYLASQAGLSILRDGGSAVDAAIAANAVLQVVFPFVVGLGGDLFLLLYDSKSGGLHALNASGRAPAAATIERYHALGYEHMPRFGIHAVTVPGCVGGWAAATARFGRLGLARLLAPAIQYAEEGFPVGPGLHAALERMRSSDHVHRSFLENYIPTGVVPPVGSIAYAPALARTLRAIATQGADVFYRGAIAEQIGAFFQREGGLITAADLAANQPDWVAPLFIPYAGMDVYELPPNTQGVTVLEMLGILDGLPLGPDPLAPQTIHPMVEAKKLAHADRARYVADPRWMRIDPAELLSADYLGAQRARLRPAEAQAATAPSKVDGDTIYLCTADGDGNAVSLIQSNYNGFGSGYVVDGTGISLQNRGAMFTLDPTAANALAPGKRPLHTLIPSLAMRHGKPAVLLGSMGGDAQTQIHTQIYTALLRYGLNIQAAIELPRWVHGAREPGAPEFLNMEQRMPRATVAALAAMGHQISELTAWDYMVGHAHGIVFDQDTGIMHGGSDPRAEGIAAGW